MKYWECPKYDACSAPLCPLDPNWRLRAFNHGERVCFFLNESVKAGAANRLSQEMLIACQSMAASEDLHCEVKAKLTEAAKSGSRIESGKALTTSQRLAAKHPAGVWAAF